MRLATMALVAPYLAVSAYAVWLTFLAHRVVAS